MGKAKNIATAAGAGVGYWVGSGLGIAGFFGAVSGAVPLALAGAYLGRKFMKSEFAQEILDSARAGYADKDAELDARREALRQARVSAASSLPRVTRQRKKSSNLTDGG